MSWNSVSSTRWAAPPRLRLRLRRADSTRIWRIASAATARVFYCTFRDYAEKWEWIASVFSRDAVLKGAFDQFAESSKAKRGTAGFDADFLATIEGWRLDLARDLALCNPKLTQRELNFAVQRIIDRIIFLRICEARGIEDRGLVLDYRHVIDHLLRKPGAFERYRYREQLFPSRSFRQAYDHLVAKHGQRGGAVEYLRLLKLASEVGESDLEVMLADYLTPPCPAWSVQELRLESELKRLDRFAAVILDDIGYVQQDRQEMEVRFTFLAERDERRSVMISSNLAFSKLSPV